MTTALLPRLKNIDVCKLLETYERNGIPVPRGQIDDIDQNAYFLTYAASGGNINKNLVISIALQVRLIAVENGFPTSKSQKERSCFDRDTAVFLATHESLRSGEALRDDVWACLTTILAPDVVAWRFPDLNIVRFSGGLRNTFQRLWMRGVALDRGADSPERWKLLDELTEDAMGAIFERASLSGSKVMAKAIAEAWLESKEKLNNVAMEDVMRCAAKIIRLKNEIMDLSSLDSHEIRNELGHAFRYAVGQILGADAYTDYCNHDDEYITEVILDSASSEGDGYIEEPVASVQETEIKEAQLAYGRSVAGIENLIELSEKAAVALAKNHVGLYLSSLTSLSDDAAIALAIHKGDLWLDGLTELSDQAAKALAMHQGRLSLSGLKEITDIAAEALSRHQGGLYLLGLTNLTEQSAKWLSSYQGELDLPLSIGVRSGLVEIPDDY
jgi:hypothetical protein